MSVAQRSNCTNVTTLGDAKSCHINLNFYCPAPSISYKELDFVESSLNLLFHTEFLNGMQENFPTFEFVLGSYDISNKKCLVYNVVHSSTNL